MPGASTVLQSLVACRSGLSAWSEGGHGQPHGSMLQRRFKWVARFIKLDPLAIPATYAVFTRSRRVADSRIRAADRTATRAVHELFSDAIQPEAVWLMGDPANAGDLLKDMRSEWRPVDHGDGAIGHGAGIYAGRPVTLCHTPDLSIWDPVGRLEELRFAFGDVAQ